ncbi:MAG TPA: DUF4976 domain-containing protein [Phycisphaerales bacterium]|nr:DUF4976 domain-containing protein [Phycisphaerales bacterium]
MRGGYYSTRSGSVQVDEWEFYDLKKDPVEMKSQYGNPKYAGKIKELKAELERLKVYYKVPKT